MVSTFDGLYANSKKGKIFNHLMEIIESEENIKLAYRTIKTNQEVIPQVWTKGQLITLLN